MRLKVKHGVYIDFDFACSTPSRSSNILRVSSTSKTRSLNSGSSETFPMTKREYVLVVGRRVGKTLPYGSADADESRKTQTIVFIMSRGRIGFPKEFFFIFCIMYTKMPLFNNENTLIIFMVLFVYAMATIHNDSGLLGASGVFILLFDGLQDAILNKNILTAAILLLVSTHFYDSLL